MHRIVHAHRALEQHQRAILFTLESYRPPRCPHCGVASLWGHGFYDRKADRSAAGALNPVLVPRFRCTACCRTCSRLPLCFCPRRWYGWALQQLVLSLCMSGMSLRRIAAVVGVDRRTVGRWWRWLCGHGAGFAFALRSRFPELGRTDGDTAFWRACLPACRSPARWRGSILTVLMSRDVMVAASCATGFTRLVMDTHTLCSSR